MMVVVVVVVVGGKGEEAEENLTRRKSPPARGAMKPCLMTVFVEGGVNNTVQYIMEGCVKKHRMVNKEKLR